MTGIPPYILRDEPVEINAGRRRVRLTVRNTGDRPVQVGSHYHFFEANPALEFDRQAAFGMRLDIPAGTAVRFEPGIEREVDLVAMGGSGRVLGFAGLTNGSARSARVRAEALRRAAAAGFRGATPSRPGDGEEVLKRGESQQA